MKKINRSLVLITAMLIISFTSTRVMAQNDYPEMPDQHGYNGDQSPTGAPLDEGTGILILLGVLYLTVKLTGKRRTAIAGQ